MFCVAEMIYYTIVLFLFARRVGVEEGGSGGSDAKPDSPTKPETTSKGIIFYQGLIDPAATMCL